MKLDMESHELSAKMQNTLVLGAVLPASHGLSPALRLKMVPLLLKRGFGSKLPLE
jgi:hypothetical protein